MGFFFAKLIPSDLLNDLRYLLVDAGHGWRFLRLGAKIGEALALLDLIDKKRCIEYPPSLELDPSPSNHDLTESDSLPALSEGSDSEPDSPLSSPREFGTFAQTVTFSPPPPPESEVDIVADLLADSFDHPQPLSLSSSLEPDSSSPMQRKNLRRRGSGRSQLSPSPVEAESISSSATRNKKPRRRGRRGSQTRSLDSGPGPTGTQPDANSKGEGDWVCQIRAGHACGMQCRRMTERLEVQLS